jgi:REP element-mobilizing transposase RayT
MLAAPLLSHDMQQPQQNSRRSIRLKGFDYSAPGNYFVTLCTAEQEKLFGEIVDRQMILNRAGEAVRAAWFELPMRFPTVVPDVFVVMPNHFHGIIAFTQPIPRAALRGAMAGAKQTQQARAATFARGAKAQQACAPTEAIQRQGQPTRSRATPQNPEAFSYPTLGKVMRTFKSLSAVAVDRALGRFGMPVWQRNYFERIVRPGREHERIEGYIIDNPVRWEQDGWDAMPDFAGRM